MPILKKYIEITYKGKLIHVSSIKETDALSFLALQKEAQKNLDELLLANKQEIQDLKNEVQNLKQEVALLKGEE